MPIFSSTAGTHSIMTTKQPFANIKPYALRQVITTGYVAGGYKDSVAWQNVNSFDFATETTTGRGNLLTHAGGYIAGAMSKTFSYTIGSSGTGSAGMANSNGVNKWNHKTYAMITTQTMPATVADPEAIIKYGILDGGGEVAYVNGTLSGTSVQKLVMTTDTWSNSFTTTIDQAGSGHGAYWHENSGVWWADSTTSNASNGQRRMYFATETEDNPNISLSTFGNQKGLCGKFGNGFAGNEGSYNGGNSFRKYNHATNTTSVPNVNNKPVLNSGEENYFTGQNKGGTLGTYTGAGQVLDSGLYTYSTDTGALLPTGQWYRGTQSGTGSSAGSAILGASSGCGTWSD